MTTDDASDLIALVRKLGQRTDLDADDIDAILALPYRNDTCSARRYVVREGDSSSHGALLLSGFAFSSKLAGDGGRQILSVHVRGDLLGLNSGLLDAVDHNVQALTPCRIACIPHYAILALAEARPAIARAFWREAMVEASIAREWLLNVGRRTARQRISHLFCELAARQEAAGVCSGPTYHWPMTQEEVADALGLTSVHVNRTLQGLRRDGLLQASAHSVVVADWAALQVEGDFSPSYLHQPAASPDAASIAA